MGSNNVCSFVVRVLSFSIIILRFIHGVAAISSSLLFIAELFYMVWLDHNWFIHQLVDKHPVTLQFLAITNKAAMTSQVSAWTHCSLLGKYLGLWLNHFTFPTASSKSSRGSTSSPTLDVVSAFILGVLVGVQCSLIIVLIFIPWWLVKLSIFPWAIHHPYIFIGEVSVQNFCPFSNWSVFFYWVLRVLGLWDLSSPIRNRTQALDSESTGS